MTGSNRKQSAVLLLCITLATLWSYQIRLVHQGPVKLPDFAAIYYGARAAILHQDPYDANAIRRVFTAENPQLGPDPFPKESVRVVLTLDVNLPTTLFVTTPIAFLPWHVAQNVWMLISAALLALGAILMCDLAPASPFLSGCLAAFLLVNSIEILVVGNVAAPVVGLCLIAVWCFLKDRYGLAGAVLLALSLVLKPHDAGFIWLYFLLAGGVARKRAWQTLAITAILGLLAAVWISRVSPHWITELHNNLVVASAPGSTSDPALSGLTNRSTGPIIDLQSVVSTFRNDPHFYNPVSYLICGVLILAWAITALRRRFSLDSAIFALAAIAPLSLLPIYHRTHDAKILLLTLPACAILWAGKGARRWIALSLTSLSIIAISDIPILLQLKLTDNLPSTPLTLSEKLADLFLLQPATLLLLVTGCFYLWVYMRPISPGFAEKQADLPASPVQIQSAP
jgi:hypothetical protein